MQGGSTLVAFEVAGGKARAFRVMNALRLIDISNNLGDSKSLVTHPATTTHQRLQPEDRAALGIGDGLLRLSVGLHDPAERKGVVSGKSVSIRLDIGGRRNDNKKKKI